jgi:hypothetical protein
MRIGMLKEHLDVAERRVIELLRRAPEAEPRISNAIRTVAAYFFNGTECVNQFADTPRPDGVGIVDWVNLRTIAWHDLSDCVRQLDQRVGVDQLVNEARLLRARRRAQFPSIDSLLGRFAYALERLAGQADRERDTAGVKRE